MIYYSFSEFWWFYLLFLLFVLFMLALDLGVFNKKAHEISFKEASVWTTVWITLALLFNVVFYFYSQALFSSEVAKDLSLQFLTGFIVEKSLAIDNIFIFAVVFGYFAIPKIYQHRVLFWGILGALIFRSLFISLGSVLMQYHSVIIFFGVLLILTGTKMLFAGTATQNLENNFVVRQLNKLFRVHPQIEGEHFFIKKNNMWFVTPLFMALFFIEVTDIIFAVDSVPAIFALTKEPLIVFTSNIFAILGLRSMYFMLAGVMDKFKYIKYGLAGVLIFVGCKMTFLNSLYDGKFPITWSLTIIAMMIGSSIAVSLFKKDA